MAKRTGRQSRRGLEALVWSCKHPDYRGKVDGRRAVLILERGGTVLAPLHRLSHTELMRQVKLCTRRGQFGRHRRRR